MTNASHTRVIFDASTEGALHPDAIAQRFTPGMHRVLLMQLDARGSFVWDENGTAAVRMVVESTEFDILQKLHRDEIVRTGSHSAARLSPSAERFGDDLPAYLRAVNIAARLCEEIPKEGTWIGALTEDLDHWAEIGVKTPADLDRFLFDCFEREMQKEMMAG